MFAFYSMIHSPIKLINNYIQHIFFNSFIVRQFSQSVPKSAGTQSFHKLIKAFSHQKLNAPMIFISEMNFAFHFAT